jgi:hypothetical protein
LSPMTSAWPKPHAGAGYWSKHPAPDPPVRRHDLPLITYNRKDYQDFADREGLALLPV